MVGQNAFAVLYRRPSQPLGYNGFGYSDGWQSGKSYRQTWKSVNSYFPVTDIVQFLRTRLFAETIQAQT